MADRLHHIVGDLVHLGTVVGDVVCGGGGMSKEAMKLALEALESGKNHGAAIDVLRRALANEALDKMAENARELGLDYEPVWGGVPTNKDYEDAMRQRRLHQLTSPPAQQEPVAAQSVMTVRIWRDKNSDQNAEFKNWHKLPDGEHILYTSPPAQRTWVSLTDKEIEKLTVELRDIPVTLAFAIEAKLKEKNNG